MHRKFLALISAFFMLINGFSQTHFIVKQYPSYTPDTAKIYMAGTMNGWNPGDTSYILRPDSSGFPEITLNESPGTQIEYKFTLGSWATVEKGPSGEEISNRTYTFPGSQDTVWITIYNWAGVENPSIRHTTEPNVHILTNSFYMPQLGRYRRIWVYLPPDYDSSNARYPVIYMHDGQNLFDDATSFAGEWHVDEHLNELAAKGYPVPIVIGIDNGGAYRIDELTPYPNATYGGGDGDKYVRFIIETLKPYVDSAFRTLPDRENTWIWGSSLGGLISFYAAVKYNDTFGRVGVFSPSFWINDPQIYELISKSKVQKPTFFYFLAGGLEGQDVASDCRHAISLLEQQGLDSVYMHLQTDPLGRHNEAFWGRWVKDAYLWLSIIGPEQADTSKKLNFRIYPNPVQDLLKIDSQYYTVRYTCQVLSMTGDILLQRQCQGSTNLDISALPTGVYVLRMIGLGQTMSRRIIKI